MAPPATAIHRSPFHRSPGPCLFWWSRAWVPDIQHYGTLVSCATFPGPPGPALQASWSVLDRPKKLHLLARRFGGKPFNTSHLEINCGYTHPFGHFHFDFVVAIIPELPMLLVEWTHRFPRAVDPAMASNAMECEL